MHSLFSEYHAKQGQFRWWPVSKSFSFFSGPPDLPETTQLSFYQVSAGLDKTVWAIDGYGYAYDYGLNDQKWIYRGRYLSRVAVFDTRLVLGIFVNRPGLQSPKAAGNEWYGDLRRYDYGTQKWISVDKGSLGSSAKFKNVAVGGTKGSEEVWAVVDRRPNSPPHLTEDEVVEIVRYHGDIASGNGDWTIKVSTDPRFVNNIVMHDLAIGRRSSGEPLICGTLPNWKFPPPNLSPRKFSEWGPSYQWEELGMRQGYPAGDIPPYPSFVETASEVSRWNHARRTFSVGNDGTIVAIMGDSAWRRLPPLRNRPTSLSGDPGEDVRWLELPRAGGRFEGPHGSIFLSSTKSPCGVSMATVISSPRSCQNESVAGDPASRILPG